MYTSAIKEQRLKTGMSYLAASIAIAAAAAVYGLFSHGVYSYFMTYAFMIPLILGALPHLMAAMKKDDGPECDGIAAESKASMAERILNAKDAQLAFIATLTAGSLLKGALDIYGTTNRLLLAYPVMAVIVLAVSAAAIIKEKRNK